MSRPHYEPSPRQIAAEASRIRSEWSEETHKRRAGHQPPPNPIPGAEKFGLALSQEQRRRIEADYYGGD